MSTKVKPCKVCGGIERYSRPNRIGACIKCHRKNNKSLEGYYRHREKNMLDRSWRLNKLLVMAKSRATNKGRDFNITTEYLIELWDAQDGCCSVSGTPFELHYADNGGPHPDGPSLDRIDSKEGYIIGNVRLVTYHVNTALSCFGEERLIKLSNDIVKLNGSVN